MRAITFLFAVLVLGCGSSKELSNTVKEFDIKKKDVRIEMGFEEKTDPFTITDARVDGTDLFLTISYKGGCKDHVFELFTDGLVMKSLPPKQRFYLRHYAYKDECDTLISKDLAFDLNGTAIAGNTLILVIEGYKGDLRMDF